jgi:hypothetical protein
MFEFTALALRADPSARGEVTTDGARAVWANIDYQIAALFPALYSGLKSEGTGTGGAGHLLKYADCINARARIRAFTGNSAVDSDITFALAYPVHDSLCLDITTAVGQNMIGGDIIQQALRGRILAIGDSPVVITNQIQKGGTAGQSDYQNGVFEKRAIGSLLLQLPQLDSQLFVGSSATTGGTLGLTGERYAVGAMFGCTEIFDTAGVCLEAN